MDKVRWGLLSTAHINHRLIPAIRASDRGELVAVASRDPGKAKAYASQWEIPRAFGSYEAMLESGAVDAVYISLPNHLHAEWSIKAMQAGIHVLCEKPLAVSVAEVDQMIETSRQTGRRLAEAFMYRHTPQMKIAGNWVHSGRLGEVNVARGVFNFAIKNREEDVRLVPEYGGGSLWDVGVYPVSFAQFILGSPPEWVSGSQWVGSSGVDEVFAGLLNFPGDRLGQIASSVRLPFYTSAEAIGTEGRLYMNYPYSYTRETPQLMFYPKDGDPVEVPVPQQMLYLGEVEDMNAAVLDGAPNFLTLQESRDHIRTIVALYQAARSRQIVNLETIE
jgi:predicted dehydrogenase